MALAVVVSHASPLGFGRPDPGTGRTGGQVNLGRLSVYGFFILSGFLISRSAMRQGIGRYTWARLLRILPGLWACLIVTVAVVAPLLYQHQWHTLAGYFRADSGPFQYLQANWATGLRQFDVSGVVAEADHQHRAFDPGFNGVLWSLAYELTCYMIVGVLAVTGVLKASRRFVLVLAVGLWVYLLDDLTTAGTLRAPQDVDNGFFVGIPVLKDYMGELESVQLAYLGFAFALGMLFQLYAERVPVNDALGVLSLVLFLGTLWVGAFYVVGIPAFAYLLFWLALRLPKPLRKVGSKHDFSYGVYIYGFLVEQALSVIAFHKHGYLAYLTAAIVGTFAFAIPSWFLVEKQALRLKNWTPRWSRGRFRPAWQ